MRLFLKLLSGFLSIVCVLIVYLVLSVRLNIPENTSQPKLADIKIDTLAPNHYAYKNNWLKKNEYGVWEMYIEGKSYERGLIYGALAKTLVHEQEVAFVNQIDKLIPSRFFQQILKTFIAFFNRDMDTYIPAENLEEMYGVSQSFSDNYNFIGPKFYRILYYHAAHDIGHALSDLRVVGCTSFAVNNKASADCNLLVGRNFDFYLGEEFARQKLLIFMKPDTGYAFASYAWAGFTGVVSGMNEMGLSVTLNASQSDIPTTARMPISLLAREILQYASTIDEAEAIAQKSDVFVSESLLIASAKDNKAVVLEKGPEQMDIYDSETNRVLCTNHYQSDNLKNNNRNLLSIEQSDTKYRYTRLNQLLDSLQPISPKTAAQVLRDRNGINNAVLGNGNPKAINQLIAYHSVIFQPQKREIYVSSSDYQLGTFIPYNLNTIFYGKQTLDSTAAIAPDPFIDSLAYKNYTAFKAFKEDLSFKLLYHQKVNISTKDLEKFIALNPESFQAYKLAGDYMLSKEQNCEALAYYTKALQKQVASYAEEKSIEALIDKTKSLCK